MVSRREYAYSIGDEIVHNGEVLKYRGEYNGEFAETVVFENKLRNEGYNK